MWRIPLKRLVCVTGVSGSGKSTLIEDVLYPALLKYHGKPTEAPGEFAGLTGAELIDDVVMVDQNPIGRTTRSNPASYVGAFDAIRALFATSRRRRSASTAPEPSASTPATAAALPATATASSMSRLQFLSDVLPALPRLQRRRYRDEVLEIRREGADGRRCSIADVLDLTVTQARAFFADGPRGGPARSRRSPTSASSNLKLGQAGTHALGGRGTETEARRAPGAGGCRALEHYPPRQAVPVR